jgi:gas vesicle protein
MEDLIMNDASRTDSTSNTGSTLMGFALGAVIGAGIALLLAPESGKQTRQRLASTARRWGKGAGETIDRARDTVAELGTDAKSAIKAGKDAFLNDRATRESRSERRMSHAGDATLGLNAVNRPGEEAPR